MKVDIKQPAPCQYALHIQLGTEQIQPVHEAVVKEMQREALIAGFRKGKAPRELVEQRYPSKIRDETVRRLTQHTLEQVATERKLKPVGPFEVTRVNFEEANRFELEAQVDVEPEFQLAEYRRLPLMHTTPVVVTEEDRAKALAKLQESMAQLVPASTGAGANPAHTPVEAGEAKRKVVPALDDEFAKDVGFENLQQLTEHLDAKLREQRQAEQAQAREQALCDALVARHRFEVPASLVTKQAQRLEREFQVRLLLSGLPEAQVKDEVAKYTEQLKTNAARHVKLAFILDRIAGQEHLSVTQDEVVERLWTLSKQWGKDPVEVRRVLDAQGLWPSVLSSLRQDNTMKFLLSVSHNEEVHG